MWTKQKEERYQELAQRVAHGLEHHDPNTLAILSEATALGTERDEWITQQLEKQGETRERLPNDKEFLQLAAEQVKARLPDGWGYILLVFQFGPGARLGYVSNAKREDAVATLKEWLLKQSPENWLKHID